LPAHFNLAGGLGARAADDGAGGAGLGEERGDGGDVRGGDLEQQAQLLGEERGERAVAGVGRVLSGGQVDGEAAVACFWVFFVFCFLFFGFGFGVVVVMVVDGGVGEMAMMEKEEEKEADLVLVCIVVFWTRRKKPPGSRRSRKNKAAGWAPPLRGARSAWRRDLLSAALSAAVRATEVEKKGTRVTLRQPPWKFWV
jgi:hypothetical protein